jgi:hypothetical protein
MTKPKPPWSLPLIDSTLEWMKKNNIPLTKENYVHVNSLGQINSDDLDGEAEADLPREIQAAELRRLRAIRRADREFLKAIGVDAEEAK